MKLHGKTIDGPNVEYIVIPRQEGDIVFKAEAVLDYKDFDAICPRPMPPERIKPGGVRSLNVEDPKYKAEIEDWALNRTHWMILKSVQGTDGLEWETVDMSDPATWVNYIQEFEDAGLSQAEVSRIVDGVTTACGMNQDKIDQAQEAFLAGLAKEQKEESSQNIEQ